MKKSPVVHFEMPYKDAKRVSKFYSDVFGWDMQTTGEDMGNYILAGTTKTKDMQSVTPGAINGGFFPASDENSHYPLVTIAIGNLQEAMDAVKAAGGDVLRDPVDIPGVGKYVPIHDCEGNRVSLLQPASM